MRLACFSFLSIALGLCSAEARGEGNHEIGRFRPALTVNNDSGLCRPFFESWQKIFEGVSLLTEDQSDLSAIYPAGEVWTFPPEGGRGLYNSSYSQTVDFDGNGDSEVLHLESNDVGWRYLGVALYLFDSEQDYRIALASRAHQSPWGLVIGRSEQPIHANYEKIADFPPTERVQILRLNGKFYSIMPPQGPAEKEGRIVDLVQLNAHGMPRTMCSVQLLPPKERFAKFREKSALFQNLKDVYGTPGQVGCLGTMGWTAPPVDSRLPTIFYRPHLLHALIDSKDSSQARRAGTKEDAAREIRFLVWGLSDPQSWQDYLGLKNGRDAFLHEIRDYYITRFSYSANESGRMAEEAWRALLDGVFYGRNEDGYTLTAMNFHHDLPISPGSSPNQIVRSVLNVWQNEIATDPYPNQFRTSVIAQQALLAAIYTRQAHDVIKWNLEQMNALMELDQKYAPNPQMRQANLEKQKMAMESALVAALGNDELTQYFLDKRVDPNALNWFGKTPLMYAAQQNQLSAVKILLNNGADVNSKTHASTESAFKYGLTFGCSRLIRDGRTALMYAAENASAELITLIIKAGGQTAAEDSRGNTALWYFEWNTLVTNPAQRRRVQTALSH